MWKEHRSEAAGEGAGGAGKPGRRAQEIKGEQTLTKAEIKAVLTSALQDGVALYWQFSPSGTGRCLVWGETGPAGSPAADNRPEERGMKGMVELYTALEEDPLFAAVEEALQAAQLPFYWESSGYDRDAGLVKHRWRWLSL